jgi:hypothetical protein
MRAEVAVVASALLVSTAIIVADLSPERSGDE